MVLRALHIPMKDDLFPQVTRHRLEALTQARGAPERVRDQAARLLDRLQSAVRVVLLGPAGVGKSQLLSALLAAPVDTAPGLPLVLSHEANAPDPAQGAARVRHASFAAPGLAGLQFLDIPIPQDTSRQASAVGWALARADIVIWCTQEFDASEASYWISVPDHLKDHSFLVLTKAQDLIDSGEIDARLLALQQIAQSEFHSLFPVETGAVADLIARGGTPGNALDEQSGIAALRRAVVALAETGRRAWEDAALVLLDRFGTQVVAEADEPPVVAAPKPRAKSETAEGPLEGGLRYIDTRAAELDLGSAGDEATREILDHCLETCETLAERLADMPGSGPDNQKFQDDIAGAADKMLLIAMEDGAGPAADAVTILLQLRRELETRLAA